MGRNKGALFWKKKEKELSLLPRGGKGTLILSAKEPGEKGGEKRERGKDFIVCTEKGKERKEKATVLLTQEKREGRIVARSPHLRKRKTFSFLLYREKGGKKKGKRWREDSRLRNFKGGEKGRRGRIFGKGGGEDSSPMISGRRGRGEKATGLSKSTRKKKGVKTECS